MAASPPALCGEPAAAGVGDLAVPAEDRVAGLARARASGALGDVVGCEVGV